MQTITDSQRKELDALLDARGILASTRKVFEIEATAYTGRPAWQYPTRNAAGVIRHRYKFADGQKPKCLWSERPENTPANDWRLYTPDLAALKDALKRSKGVLCWVSGEPDFWTLHAAKGVFPAALCSLGEGNTPDWLPDVLSALGVERVLYYPDKDDTGQISAKHLYALLRDTPIQLDLYELPAPHGSKQDLNALWQALKFDSKAFGKALHTCPMIDTTQWAVETPRNAKLTPKNAIGDNGDVLAVKGVIDTVAFIGQYVELQRKSNVHKGICPFHDDTSPSLTVYSDGYKCFSCGAHGDVIAFIQNKEGLDFPAALQKCADFAGVALTPRTNGKRKAVNLDTAPSEPLRMQAAIATPPKPKMPAFLSSSAIAARGKRLRSVRMPFATWAQWGGFFDLCPTGMQFLIVGGTGVAKTILGETATETWAAQGVSSLWYSPEWTAELFLARRVQRWTGLHAANGRWLVPVTVFDQLRHDQWEIEKAAGVPEDKRTGVPLTVEQMSARHAALANMCQDERGDIYTFDRSNVDPSDSYFVPRLLECIADSVHELRGKGHKLDVVFLDYVQMLNDHAANGRMYEEIMGKLKAHAITHDYLGVNTSQATKFSAKNAKATGGNMELADAQNVRGDTSNVAITLTPLYEDTPTGRFQRRDHRGYGLVEVMGAKNSMGSVNKATMAINFARLYYEDENVPMDIMPENFQYVPF